MLRHEFQPGRLIAGLFLTGIAISYGGDAAGWWDTVWFAAFPAVFGGLCLAALVGMATGAVRRGRRRRRRAARDGAESA